MINNDKKSELFGTDGIRDKIGASLLTPHGMLAMGLALGRVLAREHAAKKEMIVAIARDTRDSGSFIEAALTAGLNATGVIVKRLGVLPTPAVSGFVKDTVCVAGIMITASHNLATDNGIKLFMHTGDKLGEALRELIINELDKEDGRVTAKAFAGVQSCEAEAKKHYICKLNKAVEPYRQYFTKHHIVVDTANGAATSVAETVFLGLGCKVTMMANQPDGHNINEQCGSTNPEALQRLVKSEKASFGVAFDGDGDRVILVDQFGRVLHGDHMLFIHATIGKVDKIVTTSMANQGLLEALEQNGTEVILSAVGDQNIYKKMQSTGARIGAESNGHFISMEHAQSGDGLLVALLTLGMVLEQGHQLNQYHDKLIQHPQQLINLPYANQSDYDHMTSSVETLLDKYPDIDAMIRPSGTEKLLRVNLKARPEHEQMLNEVVELISKAFPKEPSWLLSDQ